MNYSSRRTVDLEQERKHGHERLSDMKQLIHICKPEGYEMHRYEFNDNQLESS